MVRNRVQTAIDRTRLLRRCATLAIAAAGAAVFAAAGLPLPFLFGPMFASLIAALLGANLLGLKLIEKLSRTVLGVAVGASLTPAVVAQLPQFAASLALLPFYLAIIAAIGMPFFHKVCGFDRATAWYASMPGGLQDMILFGKEAGGDVRALSLIHAPRVLIIVSAAPIIMTQAFNAPLIHPIGAPASAIPVHELLLMAVAAIVGWKGGEKVGLFGAAILGPMIVAGAMSLADLIHFRPPAEAIITSQFFIGITIGVGYVGVTIAELKKDVAAGVVFFLILAALAFAFTEVVLILGLAPPLEGFLAFAPGGQAEMTMLAIIAGADLGYVVIHHLARVFLVITGAPIAFKLLRMGKD
ncbi:MAG: AbrB family transcriptional regulator [Pseudomonadota bacterium]